MIIDVVFVKESMAYEMRISDWSSDVCTADLDQGGAARRQKKRKRRAVRRQSDRPRRERCAGAARAGQACLAPVAPGHCKISPRHACRAGARRRRSEERLVGRACLRTCRFRWTPYPLQTTNIMCRHAKE